MMFITLILTLCCLAFYSHGHIETHSTNRPELSTQKKKYHYVVTVKLSPTLKRPAHITWLITYITYNRKCYKATNAFTQFEGGMFPQKITEKMSTSLSKKDSLNINIPLNKYKPGHCQWNIGFIHYSINKSPYILMAKFNEREKETKTNTNTEIICIERLNNITCSYKPRKNNSEKSHSLNPRQNYYTRIVIKDEHD
jgi:hypothetical protein